MSDDLTVIEPVNVTALRDWRTQTPSVVEKFHTKVVKELDGSFEGRLVQLESQVRGLVEGIQRFESSVERVEARPHLSKDDLDNIRQAAEARAATVSKTIIDKEITPLVEELRTNLQFVREAEQTRTGGTPNSPALSELITKLLPFVQQLETATKELKQHQGEFKQQLNSAQRRIAELDSRQLEMLAASITDQRNAASMLLVGNDG